MTRRCGSLALLILGLFGAGCGDDAGGGPAADAGAPDAGPVRPALQDPGATPWDGPVAREDLADECGLDPELMDAADEAIGLAYAVSRYGKLCWEHYPPDAMANGPEVMTENFSATKTLGATVVGLTVTLSADLEASGPRTGPLSDEDRMDAWMDGTRANPDALVAHVLAMEGHNTDLSPEARTFRYDASGDIINDLLDVVQAVIDQDPAHFDAADPAELAQNHLFGPLGMDHSMWHGRLVAFAWGSNVRDMARLGTFLNHYGHWNGAQIVSRDWVYKMTHPAFEEVVTNYGYLTWLYSEEASTSAVPNPEFCSPPAINREHPHGLSVATDCAYAGVPCEQQHDVGVWAANGLGGQYVVGHRGLDLVLVNKDAGAASPYSVVWKHVRKALIALDPKYAGDEAAFCAAYGAGEYAPDLPELPR